MEKKNNTIPPDEPTGSMLLGYLKGEAAQEEIQAVQTWAEADKAHEQVLMQTARIYYACRLRERLAARNPLAAYEKVSGRLEKRLRLRRLKKTARIAASVAVMLGLSTLIAYLRPASGPLEPQWITLRAQAGMRAYVDLPDGTAVYLNAGSTLVYPLPFETKERNVRLAGEAYFKVAADEKHPFRVSVADGRYKIKVTGTQFNVRAYTDAAYISTTLVEGAVCLETKHPGGKTQTRALTPSQRARYELKSGKMEVEKINTLYETAWIEGKLIFKDTPLPEVLDKLSHYYNVDFTVQDAALENYRITGTLDNRPLSQTLDYLKLSSPIDFRIDEVKTDDSKRANRPRVLLREKNKPIF